MDTVDGGALTVAFALGGSLEFAQGAEPAKALDANAVDDPPAPNGRSMGLSIRAIITPVKPELAGIYELTCGHTPRTAKRQRLQPTPTKFLAQKVRSRDNRGFQKRKIVRGLAVQTS
jgi:hypothetical protein